jgi:hypothetical protein
MKKLAVVFLALFTVVSAKAESQETRGHFHHASAFRPRFTGTHFTARSDDRFHRHFRFGNRGVVIFDPFDYSSSYGLPEDNTVYQGQVTPQDAESLPYGTPTLGKCCKFVVEAKCWVDDRQFSSSQRTDRE